LAIDENDKSLGTEMLEHKSTKEDVATALRKDLKLADLVSPSATSSIHQSPSEVAQAAANISASLHGSSGNGVFVPPLTTDFPLASPFVQGLIIGTQESIDDFDGTEESSINEATSKMLMMVSDKATNDISDKDDNTDSSLLESNNDGTVTLSLAETEDIAREFVRDKRSSSRDAVRIAFVEMKKRHDIILGIHQNHMQTFLNIELARPKEELLASKESTKVMREDYEDQIKQLREDLTVMKKTLASTHDQQKIKLRKRMEKQFSKERRRERKKVNRHYTQIIENFKSDHDNIISDLLDQHKDDLREQNKELQHERDMHTIGLDSAMEASCNALRMLRKNWLLG